MSSTMNQGEAFLAAYRKWYKAQVTRDAFFTGTEPTARNFGLHVEVAAVYRAHAIRTVDQDFALGI